MFKAKYGQRQYSVSLVYTLISVYLAEKEQIIQANAREPIILHTVG